MTTKHNEPLARLRHHVTGAIERGEKQAIVEQKAHGPYERVDAEHYWHCHTDKTARRNASWAASDRGWLYRRGSDSSLGNYLEYGPNHYRSGHEWCKGECTCRLSQPGNIHAISYVAHKSRYFETVEQAKQWIVEQSISLVAQSA